MLTHWVARYGLLVVAVIVLVVVLVAELRAGRPDPAIDDGAAVADEPVGTDLVGPAGLPGGP